ncbi:hypothetical protein ANAPC1_00293 [Anaplasma phagocytophilum]|uniref:Uncharacterized protein n=1 Tax=Anaplasma phagocytophilum TaxID=948 RepID=A0AA45USQ7_ANAPH|nr:hypothetical protein ANAPC1_00293 [Anaplasma phagocytophilum]
MVDASINFPYFIEKVVPLGSPILHCPIYKHNFYVSKNHVLERKLLFVVYLAIVRLYYALIMMEINASLDHVR